MTESETDCCAACGQTKPVALMTQQTGYHVSFIAPAGICRDVIIADTPQDALEKAKKRAEENVYPAKNFDPVAESFCVQQITVEHPDGEQQAVWTDPHTFAQLHADHILNLLEELIGSVEDIKDSRSQFFEDIATVESTAQDASIELDRLRKKGGAQ
jgi:hypothetical protein